jgi:hypothetical protein
VRCGSHAPPGDDGVEGLDRWPVHAEWVDFERLEFVSERGGEIPDPRDDGGERVEIGGDPGSGERRAG